MVFFSYEYLWFPLIVFLSFTLTAIVRHYALAYKLLDIPNSRSAHTIPTPSSGGIAIAAVVLLALPYLWNIGRVEAGLFAALFGAGGVLTLLGLWDDHREASIRTRLMIHFLAAVWGLVCLGGLPPLLIFGNSFDLGLIGGLLAVLGLVWVLNLYNFMDGIDGIAVIEAFTVCLGAAVSYWLIDLGSHAVILLVVSSAVLGFAFWNFPTAKIFMGDAGSGFLGIALGLLALHASWLHPHLIWSWLILLGVFIVDATVTLLRRLFAGEKVYEAHSTHAYQHAFRKSKSKLVVPIVVGGINVLWLMPFAGFVALGWLDGVAAVFFSYIPLVILAFHLKAGVGVDKV